MARRAVIALVFLILGPIGALAQSCALHPTCPQMRNCAEADFYFRQCGDTARDADNDGIPCEALCGDDMQTYLMRRGAGSDGLGLAAPVEQSFSCTKHTCKQMRSCAEARYHLEHCGIHSLDGDGDGVPCESLCR